ncbi:MAG: 4-hydroxy-tetrahydrodipicolinate synthase [Bdellovibrionales bacterium]|nr:4-hydroxy-tetrahydrodipicolinate synthase [Bdellovibrionales bacterium]
MKKRNPFHGVITAVVTPFRDDQIDWPAYEKILEHQVRAKVSGIVSCGTTGESPTLSEAEKKELISFTLKNLKGTGVATIAGTGNNNTAASVNLSKWASQLGVDGIMLVSPYYNRPTQDGLFAHFSKIADSVDCPVLLYNVPGRTACEIKASTIASLAQNPKILGLKEASGSLTKFQEFMQVAPEGFNVLSGDDPLFLPMLSCGATGVVSVASNVVPEVLVQIHQNFEKGNVEAARKLHARWFHLFQTLFIEPNPIPVKALMAKLGMLDASVRLPLTEIRASHAEDLFRAYEGAHAAGGLNG